MHSCALKVGFVLGLAAALAGCGKGTIPPTAPNSPSRVGQVTISPTTISVVAGEVVQLTFSAVTPSGGTVTPTPTFTFNSSNTKVATVSPAGLVCGGVWDSFFITCNGLDSQGNPVAGTALITVSAGGVSSAPALATVHAAVSNVIVDPTSGCFSLKQTHQFTAHACSTAGVHDTSGPCAPNSREVTSEVGGFTWSTSVGAVASLDANGVATANVPGLTGVVANVGTVSSAAVPFRTCMPIQITLHINGDPAGQPTESATMNVADTRTIEADMVDEAGITTNSAPVTILSNNPEVASVAGVTLTASEPGGAGLIAACVPPSCGAGLNTPVYSNLFSVSVSGSSPATFVYAASSIPTATPGATATPTPQIVPIDTSKTPIVAGTAANLPGVPNSLMFKNDGSEGLLGTSGGIAVLTTATNGVTAVDPFVGKVLAISPDGSTAIFSNAANDPGTGQPIQPDPGSQRLAIFSSANNILETFVLPGAISAAFTADSSKGYIGVNNGNVYVFSTFQTLQTLTLAGSPPVSDSAVVAGSAYAYFATSQGVQVVSTCNNVQQPVANNPPTNTNTLQLLGSIDNANMIVAVDTTGIDIVSATINSVASTNPTFPFVLSPANCAPPVSYSNEFHDFGVGAFTARQLVTPTNGLGVNNGSHIMVLPVGMHQLLVAVPGGGAEVIPLSGTGGDPLSGGMTLDANTAWVGVDGSNDIHQILLTNPPNTADALQISMPFKPNIVAVKPH